MSRVYETAIKIGASIARTFKSDTLGAAAAMLKLTDTTKKLKEAEKAAASYKKLDDAVKRSKTKYDQASAALRRLEEAEKAAGGATKESTQWQKAGARAVAAAAREMDRATKAAEKNGKALRELGVDTSKLAAEQDKLAARSRFAAAREKVFGEHKEKDPEPLMKKFGGQARSVARDVAILGTAAAGAGVAMAGLVMKSIDTADEIGDTSEKIGVSAKALQELRYGAKQSGAETEELDKSLSKMLVTIGHFKSAKAKAGGGGPGSIAGLELLPDVGGGDGDSGGGDQDPFKRIGLNAKKLALLKPDEQIRAIADGMKKLKTQADRAATAAAIFGKGGVALLPMLSKGAAGLDDLSAKANKFGGVLDDDVIDAAGNADMALKDAEMAMHGVTTTLGAALLPTAVKVFKEFSGWVASNREQIKKWAENIATWIETKGLPAIVKFGGEIKSLASTVINGATKLANLVGGFDNLAIAVGALRLAPMAKTLGEIALEGGKAAAALLRFAAANKAANAVGGGSGGGGGVGGVLGGAKAIPVLSSLVGGLAAGGELGDYLEKNFGDAIDSGDLFGVRAGQQKLAAMDAEKAQAIKRRDAVKAGRGAAQTLKLWESLGLVNMPRGGGAAGGKTEINVNVGGDPTRDQLAGSMAQATKEVLAKHDERNRRRVSFAE
jgi:hypothetical protein